jgi:hypothetical protein
MENKGPSRPDARPTEESTRATSFSEILLKPSQLSEQFWMSVVDGFWMISLLLRLICSLENNGEMFFRHDSELNGFDRPD